jgi:tetratricopeptide (TPR) repeat protein
MQGHAMRNSGDLNQALAHYRQARDLSAELVARDAQVVEYTNDLAKCWFDMGTIHGLKKEPEQALSCYEQSERLRAALVAAAPGQSIYHHDLGLTRKNLSLNLWRVGRRDEAIAVARLSVQAHRNAMERAPDVPAHRKGVSGSLGLLAEQLRVSRRFDEAAEVIEECVRLWWPGHGTELYLVACDLALIAQRCEPADRQRHVDRTLELLRQALKAGWKDTRRLRTDPEWKSFQDDPQFKQLATVQL